MEIEGIRYQYYDKRGLFFSRESSGKRKKKSPGAGGVQKPIEAITFDVLTIGSNNESENEVALLTQLVKSLPDEYVKERIDQLRDSYPIIDDFLVEKLIMEVL